MKCATKPTCRPSKKIYNRNPSILICKFAFLYLIGLTPPHQHLTLCTDAVKMERCPNYAGHVKITYRGVYGRAVSERTQP